MRTLVILVLAASCAVPLSQQADAGKRKKDAEPEVLEKVPEQTDSEAVLAMHRHLALVDGLRDAVIAGDLDRAKEAGRTLSRQPPIQSAPATWVPWLSQIQQSAGRVEDAWDLESASRTTAEIARVCASCHRAEGGGPTYEAVPAPGPSDGDVQTHMLHHKASVDLMWEGLVAADDDRFKAGADALAAAELDPEDAAPELDDMVHRLAAYGGRVKGVAARADTLGAILATCARCHEKNTP